MSGRAARGPVLRFLVEAVRPYWGLQLEILFCLVVGVVLSLADPLLLRVLIDRALGDGDAQLLYTLSGVLLGVLVFRTAFRLLSVGLTSYAGLRILFDLRRRVFEHVQRLSLDVLRGERTGDVLARMTSDIDVLQRAAAHTVVTATQDVFTIAAVLAALWWLDPTSTLVLLGLFPVLALALRAIQARMREESRLARRSIGDLFGFLEERLAAIGLVQAHRRERAQARAHVRVSRPWIAHNLRLSVLGAWQVSLTDAMTTLALIAVFLFGGLRAIRGELSLGSLVAYYTLAGRLVRPIAGLVDVHVDLAVAGAALQRVYELLDRPTGLADGARTLDRARVVGGLRLRGVEVVLGNTRVLDGVDLAIEGGSRVALVGPSGGGKSTLASLLVRARDPARGRVELDGVDLREYRLADLRHVLGHVPQDAPLLDGTLAENLRLARRNASEDELFAALERCGLADLVRELPDGLATRVGAGGQALSGGERQRLA
ncbi:MAG TPA: ABC transporter ATP-binding protein, partial [Planctomycetota bacterium]|nr:ABC transporter ATP-binding protein [Planctomycetota bacterium]